MSKNLYEIFENITTTKNPTDLSIEAELRKFNNDIVIKTILEWNFSKKFCGFDLAQGNKLYRIDERQPYGYAESNIYSQFKRFYIFFNGFVTLTREQKELRFIQLLECLHFREAELLIAVKDKELTKLFPDIDEALVRKVFPEILPPLSEEDGILVAALGGRNSDENNLVFKLLTKDEVLHLHKYRKIIFKFPEQAILNGLEHLLPDYVAPPEVYDYDLYPELYLEFTVENNVFGKLTKVVYHQLLVELDWEEIEKLSKHGAKLTFTDLVQAKNLGLEEFDVRNKPVVVKPTKKIVKKPRAKKKVVVDVNGKVV
jgi:hypothetical protein